MAEKYEGEEEFADEQLLADFIATVHDDLDPVIWLRGDVFPDAFAPDSSLRVRTLEAMGRA